MQWNLTNDRPIYVQLAETLMHAIAAGSFPAGGRIPSVRDLAEDAGVNPNTMQRALAELERTGLIYSVRTTGKFVTEETGLIQEKRKELAMKQIQIFLSSMKELGYSAQETIELIRQAMQGEEST